MPNQRLELTWIGKDEEPGELYTCEDEIDLEKERLQEEIRQKLQGNCVVEHIMTIGFEVI